MSSSLNSTNLELVGHFEKKKQKQKRLEFIDRPVTTTSVTYGKYTTRVPDVVAYGFYEFFSANDNVTSFVEFL